MFSILAKDAYSQARCGLLSTVHGTIQTPIFMPVGTQATVKSLLPSQLEEIGAQVILGNTYHLNLRPTSELIRELGGLHSFMRWKKPILTDSGGFQVFSLSKLRTIKDDGILFSSHLDGKKLFLTPQRCFEIQANLGSDIQMVLDECPPWSCEPAVAAQAVSRTVHWAKLFFDTALEAGTFDQGYHVFGIVQGSVYEDLRRQCAEALAQIPFSGYAIGGVSVGEPEAAMLQQVEATVPFLPLEKPRYVMGVGTPPQLLKMIALGIDMFDCVIPTRLARHGTAFTPNGPINLRNERFRRDERPLVEGMANLTCQHFSRAYLRHLVVAKELLAGTLLSLHNVHFFLHLMDTARQHIREGTFQAWHLQWIQAYLQGV